MKYLRTSLEKVVMVQSTIASQYDSGGSPYIVFISTSGMLCSSDIYILYICDMRSNNVSQRSVSTSWEMQNKQFVIILTLFFICQFD